MGKKIQLLGGESAPGFMYGTAWKEDETARLVRLALDAGFRAIDTANQRKHYHEAGVGEALEQAIADGVVARDEVFLQTKFTYRGGQDHRLPYDPDADFTTQVRQSFAKSLEHLGIERIDSYVLHGPQLRCGLSAGDHEVWDAMQELQDAGKTRVLGVSNVGLDQLEALCARAKTSPAFVQNRCYAAHGWDREVRAFCRERGIVYQGFSLLTANRREISSSQLESIAKGVGKSLSQVVFRFALQVGMLPLTGTTDPAHMAEDLGMFDFELSDADVAAIESISG